MSKYKVGDKVRVRSDLVVGKTYFMEDNKITSNSFVGGMLPFKGEVVEIIDIISGQYRINGSISLWTDEMFEPVCKFKVGDYVIGNEESPYGITRKGWIGEVVNIRTDGLICVKGRLGNLDNSGVDGYPVYPEYFDLYNCNHKIVITVDGRTTTARLYENDKVVKSAQAKCNPEDKFDFNIGARLAFDRLVGEKSEAKEESSLKIEIGKKYVLKDFDKVSDHIGIRPSTWKSIQKAGCVTPEKYDKEGNSYFCNSGHLGHWYIGVEAFECEYIEPSIDGFKIGDRVNWRNHNGTVICFDEKDIGVQFDEAFDNLYFHNCCGRGTKKTCRWLGAADLKHGGVEKFYNGKVVCVDSGIIPDKYTVGKIYTIEDGDLRRNDGSIGVSKIVSVDKLNKSFATVKFLEIKE